MSGIMLALAATGGPTVRITNQTISDVLVANPSSAAYQLLSTGIVQSATNSGNTTLENWITPQLGMSGYDARATVSATNGIGTLNGAIGTWDNLGTTRTWELVDTTNTLATRDLLIEISVTGAATAIASATITLRSTST